MPQNAGADEHGRDVDAVKAGIDQHGRCLDATNATDVIESWTSGVGIVPPQCRKMRSAIAAIVAKFSLSPSISAISDH